MTHISSDRAATPMPVSEADVAALVMQGREQQEEASRAQRVARRGARRAEGQRELAAMHDAADARFRAGMARATSRIVTAGASVAEGLRRAERTDTAPAGGASAEQAAERAAEVAGSLEQGGVEGARAGLDAYATVEDRAASGHDARAKAHGEHVAELSDEIRELGATADRAARLGERALEHLEAFERARNEATRAVLRG